MISSMRWRPCTLWILEYICMWFPLALLRTWRASLTSFTDSTQDRQTIVALCLIAFEMMFISRSLKSSCLKSCLYERSGKETGLSGKIRPSVSAVQTTICVDLKGLNYLDSCPSGRLSTISSSEVASEASDPRRLLNAFGEEPSFWSCLSAFDCNCDWRLMSFYSRYFSQVLLMTSFWEFLILTF